KLGNLMLSSCPGKMVHLTGPVRGHSAICQDIDTDLWHISQVRARCIVCCLHDQELNFLGICWSDYVSSAHWARMDILGIPLLEGLAPLLPQSPDESLTKLINNYTMYGKSILVHCCGGLGRAGLIACCWVPKISLCRWINVDLSLNPAEGTDGLEKYVRRDTLQLIKHMITVVQGQQSIKVIETLKQV
ncbi:hypothetical protein BDR06DRAFT_1062653, partial [Suillus hirtellus]